MACCLFDAYFENSFFCEFVQITVLSDKLVTVTMMGYSSRQVVLTLAFGNTLKTAFFAVSRSCPPPSQFRQYLTSNDNLPFCFLDALFCCCGASCAITDSFVPIQLNYRGTTKFFCNI
eukprot:2227_1